MSENASNRPLWPFVLLALGLIAAFLFRSIRIEPGEESWRPTGTVEDLVALSERTDTNILFVLIDTLRAERMSAYGYERETTPFLSELAKTGIRFDRHIAQSSWTKSSMASLWSGLTPLHVGVTKFNHSVPDEVVMPAELLADAGFMNVGLYRNGWVHGYFGFDQGFDKYFRPMGLGLKPSERQLRPNAQAHGNDETMIDDAIEFLRLHGDSERWFLYLHLMDLHEYTYDEESALFGNTIADLYDNSMLRTDWVISKLYDHLGKRGLLDDTIIVVLSDHGEAFGERGFEGHARAVFPETTETPLIISLPFALEAPIVVDALTSNEDVWPTILDLVGVADDRSEIDGHSRFEAIVASARGTRTEAIENDVVMAYLDENWGRPGTNASNAVTVLDGPYRYVAGSDGDGKPFESLFSIEDGQTFDLADSETEVLERLREVAQKEAGAPPRFEQEFYELDQMQLDQLRALGYEIP
ncbi:MAG: sulfatase [Myxococcota bacterium]